MESQKGTNLTQQQLQFIDFVAAGQITIEGQKLTYEEFANVVGVDRRTLYKWQKSIPDFWKTVATRSSELIDRKVPRIINAMYIKALKGDVAAAKLLLNQSGQLKPNPSVSYLQDKEPSIDTIASTLAMLDPGYIPKF